MTFVSKIISNLKANPDRICIVSGLGDSKREYSSGEIYNQVIELGSYIRSLIPRKDATIGIVMQNSADWVIADLACLLYGITVLPLPLGFSRYQAEFLANQCDAFLIDERGRQVLTEKWQQSITSNVIIVPEITSQQNNTHIAIQPPPTISPEWICKIIHTSGTTSRPKGVRQSLGGIDTVLGSLLQRVPSKHHKTYLSVVPLSLLIEQVTAIYLPLLSEGTIHFLEPELPLIGERNCKLEDIVHRLKYVGATAVTVPPIMLDVFLSTATKNEELKKYLQGNIVITVGGAPVSVEKIKALRKLNIYVYEGYGLSENGSVVSVGTADVNRIGSVGKPLPHVTVRINQDNIIEIKSSSLFFGYSEIDPSACSISPDGWLNTGDIGYINDEGYLYVTGRVKNVLCLPNGRNVSPEQIEISFRDQLGVEQAVLFLSHNHRLTAFLVTNSLFEKDAIQKWAEEAFSEVERPDELWVAASNSDEWLSIMDKPTVQKRKSLAEILQSRS